MKIDIDKVFQFCSADIKIQSTSLTYGIGFRQITLSYSYDIDPVPE